MVASPAVTPVVPMRLRYRTYDASPLLSLGGGSSLAEEDRQDGPLRTWLVDIPKAFMGRIRGGDIAAKEVLDGALGRSTDEVSGRNGGGNRDRRCDAYRDVPEMEVGPEFTIPGELYKEGVE